MKLSWAQKVEAIKRFIRAVAIRGGIAIPESEVVRCAPVLLPYYNLTGKEWELVFDRARSRIVRCRLHSIQTSTKGS